MIAVNSISGGELDDIREGDETSDEEMKKTTRTSNNVKRGDEKKTQWALLNAECCLLARNISVFRSISFPTER